MVDTLEFHNCLAFQVLFRSLDVIPYPFTHSPLAPWAIGLTPSGRIHLSYPLPLKDVYHFLYRRHTSNGVVMIASGAVHDSNSFNK